MKSAHLSTQLIYATASMLKPTYIAFLYGSRKWLTPIFHIIICAYFHLYVLCSLLPFWSFYKKIFLKNFVGFYWLKFVPYSVIIYCMDRITLDNTMLRIARGDEVAFEELYNHTKNGLYSFILSICGDHHMAEDIMQTTYIRIRLSAKMYKAGSNTLAWI